MTRFARAPLAQDLAGDNGVLVLAERLLQAGGGSGEAIGRPPEDEGHRFRCIPNALGLDAHLVQCLVDRVLAEGFHRLAQ